jgi:hypothetical protein
LGVLFLFLRGRWVGEGGTSMIECINTHTNTLLSNRGLLKLKNQKAKYQITQPGGKLAETEGVVLKVHYNVQPWVGLLTWTPQVEFGRWKLVKGGVSKVFNLPGLKKKAPAGEGMV